MDRRALNLTLWAFLLIAVLPSLAWCQITVQYRTLSLAEAAYLYSGLAMQSVLRASSLRQLPQVIVVCCTIWLVYRRVTVAHPQPFMSVIAYLVSCTLILVLFWPEAAPRFFGGATLTRVFPGAVTSYVAERNVMTVTDAGASGLVPASLQTAGGAPVPRLTDLLLRVATSVPLTLGESIDSAGLARPFERVPVMRELMEQEVPSELTEGMPDFVRRCYAPATVAAVKNPALTFDQIVPWSSIMSTELAKIRISTEQGLFKKIKNFFTGTPPVEITCRRFYRGMERKVRDFLAGESTQQGSTKSQVYQTALGMTAQSQARFYVHRELEKVLGDGAAINVPDQIVTMRRAVDAASFATGVVGNFSATSPGSSFTGEVQKLTARMSTFLGTASFLVNWAPYIMGITMFAVLGLFPIVLLWSMFPGQHFKPIINYFMLLIFVCSTPLWWAMINVVAQLVFEHYKPSPMWAFVIPQWSSAAVAEVIVTIIGLFVVPVIQAVLLFGSWRAIGGIWRA